MRRGPYVFLLTGIGLATASALELARAPELADGLRGIIRLTARSSFALFLLAFLAAPLAALWPSPVFAALGRLRRWLGLSFALSHAVHGLAIVALAQHAPALFWTLTTPGSVVSGGIAYGFILLMTATSWDGAARWRGGAPWRLLHRVGVWFLWISFTVAFGKRVPVDPLYTLPLVLLAFGGAVRLAAAWTKRRRRAEFLAQG